MNNHYSVFVNPVFWFFHNFIQIMDDFDREAFKRRVKEAVKGAGGNKEVSAKTGIGLSTLGNVISGASAPSIENTALIASACNVSLDWLVFGKEEHIDDATFERMLDHSTLKHAMMFVLDEYQRKNGMIVTASSQEIASKMLGVFIEMNKR